MRIWLGCMLCFFLFCAEKRSGGGGSFGVWDLVSLRFVSGEREEGREREREEGATA